MKYLKEIVPVIIAGLWINISEFVRNEIMIKSLWTDHYRKINLIFPSEPLNAGIWLLWGFTFAAVIFVISKKFTLFQTVFISFAAAFVMLWFVAWNLGVLPIGILIYAIPLGLLETFVAAYIIKRFQK